MKDDRAQSMPQPDPNQAAFAFRPVSRGPIGAAMSMANQFNTAPGGVAPIGAGTSQAGPAFSFGQLSAPGTFAGRPVSPFINSMIQAARSRMGQQPSSLFQQVRDQMKDQAMPSAPAAPQGAVPGADAAPQHNALLQSLMGPRPISRFTGRY